MDVSVNSLEKAIVAGPFDNNETTEYLLSVSNVSDKTIYPRKNNEEFDISSSPCIPKSDNLEINTYGIINRKKSIVTDCEPTNLLETNKEAAFTSTGNETVCCLKVSIEKTDATANSLGTDQVTENVGAKIVNSGNSDESSTSFLDLTVQIICTETANDRITCNRKTEAPSKYLAKEVLPNNFMKSEEIVVEAERKNILQIICEIEKFFDAINSTNKDMEKKSGILLQKQNLVDEILSYIHAVQSIIRLSTSRSVLTRTMPKNSMAVSPDKPFYEAGGHILEELKLYRSELKSDFKTWETYRKEILEISEQMLYDFELCKDEMSAKLLMHEISTKICTILRYMEKVTSKREDRNENCIDLMDSVDTYIRYSSAFIMCDRTITHF